MKPSQYYAQGYNCAESMIKTYNEEFHRNIPLGLGSGMGVGACSGSLCGAVNGAILIIGAEKGRNDNSERNEANLYVRMVIQAVREKYASEICKNLKANGVSCGEIMDFSYETLKKALEL